MVSDFETSNAKKQRLSDIINYRVKVITLDSRQFIGELLSFDKHYNLVLANVEEYRLTKKSKLSLKDRAKSSNSSNTSSTNETNFIQEQKRSLGLIILRGEHVISVTIESPPTKSVSHLKTLKSGKGAIKPIQSSTNSSANVKINKPIGAVPGFTGAPRGFNPPPGFRK
ncbi:hypothetical protein WICMUC_000805 [Wickerhamomyces mucosus]|uniref:Sm protein B n=1 Tax=Wickerhamomyces mucosus TaxID=1378264 RepID=A0A9P8PY34_9ASCO|nr:hypothetical protein WICMUC_000805 [Wickerhamomyces mucosus]